MLERDVLKKIILKLKLLEITGDVIWWQRLQSGRFGKVTIGKAGTPDLVAVINQRNGSVAVVFIEVKKSGEVKKRFEQNEFFKKMEGKPKVKCSLINDPDQWALLLREVKNI